MRQTLPTPNANQTASTTYPLPLPDTQTFSYATTETSPYIIITVDPTRQAPAPVRNYQGLVSNSRWRNYLVAYVCFFGHFKYRQRCFGGLQCTV